MIRNTDGAVIGDNDSRIQAQNKLLLYVLAVHFDMIKLLNIIENLGNAICKKIYQTILIRLVL